MRWTRVAFFFALLAVGSTVVADDSPATLDIYFIDVDGGAATLLVTPDRESILIDSGWPGFAGRDAKRIEYVVKTVAKLDHIDYLITTHWHRDHFGGVENLVKLVKVEQFLDRGLPDPTKPDGDKLAFPDGPFAEDPLGIAYRKASEGKRKSLLAGDRLPLKGKIEGLVLASGGKVLPAPESSKPNPACETAPADLPEDTSDNAKSLAFRFRLGQFNFFDAGDLTWNVEKQLVCPTDRVGSVDLYQVTHHGLNNSSHPTLLKTLAPTVAIMNNGPKKGGSPETVKRLKALPSIQAAYQLHKNAATTAEQNTESELIANSEPAGGEFIHVTVKPDGSSYSVQVGVSGKPRTFQTK